MVLLTPNTKNLLVAVYCPFSETTTFALLKLTALEPETLNAIVLPAARTMLTLPETVAFALPSITKVVYPSAVVLTVKPLARAFTIRLELAPFTRAKVPTLLNVASPISSRVPLVTLKRTPTKFCVTVLPLKSIFTSEVILTPTEAPLTAVALVVFAVVAVTPSRASTVISVRSLMVSPLAFAIASSRVS